MAITVKSMATSGVDGFMVEIEATVIRGQQQMMSIIGLPDQAIKEAGERIQASIESCGYDIPKDKVIKMLNDMPVVLYVKGSLEINEHKRSVGIIGARRCSTEGKKAAVVITEREIRSDSVIVSGMAKGIDSYAHTAAIKNQAYTIAVLGSGPDICYPREHERLYEEIVLHGCIVSEYPPGTEPKNYSFPKRNRLIAALSDIVYVVDTGRKSGTFSTVAACKKYNRKVRMIDVMETYGLYTTSSMTDAEDCGNTLRDPAIRYMSVGKCR